MSTLVFGKYLAVSHGLQGVVAFRVVVLLNLVATAVSLWLAFEPLKILAMNLVYFRYEFFRGYNQILSISTVVSIAQLLLQTPALALCALLFAGFNFWAPSRWLMIALAPIVACIEFMLLVRGMTYAHVAFAPVPLITTALLLLFLFNAAIMKRFASDEGREEKKGPCS